MPAYYIIKGRKSHPPAEILKSENFVDTESHLALDNTVFLCYHIHKGSDTEILH